MSLTAAQVKDLITTLWSRSGSNRVDDADLRTVGNAIVDLVSALETEIFPDWTSGLTFQTDGTDDGRYCKHPDTDGKKRIFETKVDDNIGNAPPTDPLITENTEWKEISQSSKSGIVEWSAGVFGEGLIIVAWNHSTDGDNLYKLVEPVRPFASTNIETEIAAGKWAQITHPGIIKNIVINEVAHGYAVGEFLTIKDGGWAKCSANDISFARVLEVVDVDNVQAQLESELLDGFTGLTPFDTYWHGADGGYQTVNNGNPAFVAISATQAISYPVPASTIVSTGNPSRREYPLLIIDTSVPSGNIDLNIFNGYEDAVATIEFRISAIKTVDGAKAYSRVAVASFHKDGTANPVLMDTVTDVHGPKTTGSSDLTTTISASGAYVRFAFNSTILDNYRITVWATISITQL